MKTRPVFRFAPSPNGYLHLGHAYSALITFRMAERFGGRFLLRMEDIDIGRTRPEYVQAIYDDLKWLGITWEDPVRVQSEHFSDYDKALVQLEKQNLLYPCFATRREISEALARSPVHALDPDGAPLYPGLYKNMPASEIKRRINEGRPYASRIHMDRAMQAVSGPMDIITFDNFGDLTARKASPQLWGDAVIKRKDTPTSYHLSVVVDDALQEVTHIVRGKDLDAATDLHCLLQKLLQLPAPIYHHHDLIMDDDKQKLSKSRNSKSLRDLRNEGLDLGEIHKKVAHYLE